MKSKNKSSGKMTRGLSGEDAALWQYVTRDVRPSRTKGRVGDVDPNDFERLAVTVPNGTVPPKPKPVAAKPRAIASEPSKKNGRSGVERPNATKSKSPPAVVLERRKIRRIARGTTEIEARLDLHGMTQDEAHGVLLAFIRRCYANGYRTVLVITGKGGSPEQEDDVPLSGRPRSRGVLKRNVPRWLAEPDLRSMVVSYTNAHVRHGGEGALYVMLRKGR